MPKYIINMHAGSEWEIYNEYFQWEPESNYNSDANTVEVFTKT